MWRGRGAGGGVCADDPPHVDRRLVSGAGDIKLTKDGNVLLQEMVSWFLLSRGWASWGSRGWGGLGRSLLVLALSACGGGGTASATALGLCFCGIYPCALRAKCPLGGR